MILFFAVDKTFSAPLMSANANDLNTVREVEPNQKRKGGLILTLSFDIVFWLLITTAELHFISRNTRNAVWNVADNRRID